MFDLWRTLDSFDTASLWKWALEVAPGNKGKPGAYGDCYGFAGAKSRCPLGYGFGHWFLETTRRFGGPAVNKWLLDHFYLGCRVVPLAMRDVGRPPGEVAAPHGANLDQYDPYIEKDTDVLRHTNPSALIRLATEPEILEMEPSAKKLLEPAVFGYKIGQTKVPGIMDWLVQTFLKNPARMQAQRTRMHYPISTAVQLYRYTDDPNWIKAAAWLVEFAYRGFARPAPTFVGLPGMRMWDRGRPADIAMGWPIPDGDHYLHSWVWYQSLMGQSLLELYLQPPCPEETRELIEDIVTTITDWYLFRDVTPLAELACAGDLSLHNSPLQGGFFRTASSYWLTEKNLEHRMTWKQLLELPDDEPYYPIVFQRYMVTDGRHFDHDIDGRTRCYYSRRNCGNPAPLGPLLEACAPNFGAADLLEIRAMIEEKRGNLTNALEAHELALQVLHDSVLYFNQRYIVDSEGKWLLKHRGQSHMLKPRFSAWDTSEGNNRTPYWLLNGHRVLRMRKELDK